MITNHYDRSLLKFHTHEQRSGNTAAESDFPKRENGLPCKYLIRTDDLVCRICETRTSLLVSLVGSSKIYRQKGRRRRADEKSLRIPQRPPRYQPQTNFSRFRTFYGFSTCVARGTPALHRHHRKSIDKPK